MAYSLSVGLYTQTREFFLMGFVLMVLVLSC